jgi:hypothetical protein
MDPRASLYKHRSYACGVLKKALCHVSFYKRNDDMQQRILMTDSLVMPLLAEKERARIEAGGDEHETMAPAGFYAANVFQVRRKTDSFPEFVDMTSWMSCVKVEPAEDESETVSRWVAAARELYEAAAGKPAESVAVLFEFPMFLFGAMCIAINVNECYQPVFYANADGTASAIRTRPHLRPYFDVEYHVSEAKGMDVPWKQCAVERRNNVPFIKLPDNFRRLLAKVMGVLNDCIVTADIAPQETIADPTPLCPCPEPWRVLFASRKKKFSIHAFWMGGQVIETTIPIKYAVEDMLSERVFLAKGIDTAVYRTNQSAGFQMRVMSPTKDQRVEGALLPVNSKGETVCFADALSSEEAMMRAGSVCSKHLICVFKRGLTAALETTLAISCTWDLTGSTGRRGRSSCAEPALRLGGLRVCDVFGDKGVCSHVQPLFLMLRGSKTGVSRHTGKRYVVIPIRSLGPRVCHAGTKHNGNQRFMMSITEDGVVRHYCFPGSKKSTCSNGYVKCKECLKNKVTLAAIAKKILGG